MLEHSGGPLVRGLRIAVAYVGLAAFATYASAAAPARPADVVRQLILRGEYLRGEAAARGFLGGLPPTPTPAKAELLDLLVEARLHGDGLYLPETQTLVDSAVAMRIALHGPDHPAGAMSLFLQAHLVAEKEGTAASRPLVERVLANLGRSPSPDRSVLVQALSELGSLRAGEGDRAGAHAALDSARALTEAEPPGLERAARQIEIATRYAFILLYYEDQRAAARKLLEAEIPRASRALGDEHPLTLEAQYMYSLLLARTERPKRIELQRQVAAAQERRLGPRHPALANTLMQLGVTYWRAGSLAAADSVLRRSVAVAESIPGGGRVTLAGALNLLGNVLEAQDRLTEAREALLRALELNETYAAKDRGRMAFILSDMANVENRRDQFTAAQALYDRALAYADGAPDVPPDYLGLYLTNAGWLRLRLGDYAGARRHLERAIATFDSLTSPAPNWQARAHSNLGDCLMLTGEKERGVKHHERALEISRSFHEPLDPQLARMELTLAGAYGYVSRDSAARSQVERARAILAGSGRLADVQAGCDEVEAWLLERAGHYAAAESLYLRTIKVIQDEHAASAWMGGSLISLARTLRRQDRLAEAESVATLGASAFEMVRKRVQLGVERATFVNQEGSPYPELAAIRLAVGSGDAAWDAMEHHLGRVLADLLSSSGSSRLEPAETAMQDSLRRRLDELEQQVDRLASASRVDSSAGQSDEQAEAVRLLQAASAAWNEFQLALSQRYPEEEGRPLDLERVRLALDAKTAVIGWLDLADRDGRTQSWGYVVRSTGPVFWARLESGEGDAFAAAAGFRRELWNSRYLSRGSTHYAQLIWKRRIEPLLTALQGVRHITAVTAGALAGVPIEAARDGKGHLLAERFTVSYAPSATIFALLLQRGGLATDARSALVVGDPKFSPTTLPVAPSAVAVVPGAVAAELRGIADSTLYRSALGGDPEALDLLPPLPGTRREAETIAALARTSILLLGEDASEERLTELATSGALDSIGTLHFATHALADDHEPWRSSLVLSRTGLHDSYAASLRGHRTFDGRLTASEILREWRLHARLVTLSACQTGMGRDLGGEGIVGLSHAFLQAGAQSVLASLWPVDDRATSMLMRRFYEEWWGVHDGRKGATKSEALRRAKQWLRAQPGYDRAFYWAGFVLVGDPL